VAGRFPWRYVLPYWAAVGGVTAAAVVALMFEADMAHVPAGSFARAVVWGRADVF